MDHPSSLLRILPCALALLCGAPAARAEGSTLCPEQAPRGLTSSRYLGMRRLAETSQLFQAALRRAPLTACTVRHGRRGLRLRYRFGETAQFELRESDGFVARVLKMTMEEKEARALLEASHTELWSSAIDWTEPGPGEAKAAPGDRDLYFRAADEELGCGAGLLLRQGKAVRLELTCVD